MHSIRTKIIALTLAAILVSVLAAGGIGSIFIRLEGDRNAEGEMRLVCDSRSNKLNRYLMSIEQSVGMVAHYATEALEPLKPADFGLTKATGLGGSVDESTRTDAQRQRLERALSVHIEKIETVFRSVASNTNGVISYYYRINPELSDSLKGFRYSRIDRDTFHRSGLVNIFDHDPRDTTHVGWYYPPLKEGKATWIDPFFNASLGIDMVSYVSPIYMGEVFVGVIGMDISHSKLISQIENLDIYETGYACLVDRNGILVHHPRLPRGQSAMEISSDVAYVITHFRDMGSDIVLVNYSFLGVEKKAAVTELENGLKLIVTAPLSEINASWMRPIRMIGIAGLIIMILFAFIGFSSMKRITDPLWRLVEASEKLAEGIYDVKLEYKQDDEVGTLTRSFQHLVNHLNVYIQDLNSRIYQDALTSVKNKAAFDTYTHALDQAILTGGSANPPKFAFVMMDCNELKGVNDHCGHDKGDIYLQNACALICRIFANSPVFRLGGDEFAAILQQEDYQHRDQLLRDFDQQAAEITARATQPWETISISKGMAVYDPAQDDSVDSVLRRADQLMYENKAQMKAGRR